MPLFLKSSNSLILQTWISIRRRDTGRARCGITRLKVAQNRLPPHLCLFTFHLYYHRLYTQAHTKNESDNTNKRTWRIKRAPNVTLARVPSGILFPSVDAQITHLQTKPWPTHRHFLQLQALAPTPPPHWTKDSRRWTLDKGDPRRRRMRTRRTRTLRTLRESKEDWGLTRRDQMEGIMRAVRGLSYVQSRVSPLHDRSMCAAPTFRINSQKNHVWFGGAIDI